MKNLFKKITFGTAAMIGGGIGAFAAGGPAADRPADAAAQANQEQQERPNILVIFGDDIGIGNISAYNRGLMGYYTPNIDRIAHDGMMFTDYYGEQSCTAGRSAFITGQSPFRTGLSKVGTPGAALGIQKEDPTIAELLKPLGYATGQFGKNHLGDRDEFLPTNHGFDEFFGNLYHLNAEEGPEHPDWPKDPEFNKKSSPRGVIHSYADGTVTDTGPLTKKRMETIDEEFLDATVDFIKRSAEADQPFFCWFNTTRMHVWTHVKEENLGKSGQGFYNDGMVEHDGHVGVLLDLLDDLGISDNTIVLYTTDNGPHFNMWPDGAITPFRGEKNTNWEGGYRVPALIRWPGHIAPGSISNEIVSATDWMPTFLAAAGEPEVKEKLLKGYQAGDMTYKVHIDGYNILPHLTGKSKESGRTEYYYFNDDGLPVAMRFGDWKLVFAEQRAHGFEVWAEPFVIRRAPLLFNLRRDPFERANTDSDNYEKWLMEHDGVIRYGITRFAKFMSTFEEFPPRQRPASFSVDQIYEKYVYGK